MTDTDMDRMLESYAPGTSWVDFGPGKGDLSSEPDIAWATREQLRTLAKMHSDLNPGIGPHLRLSHSGPGWKLWAPRGR